VNEGEVDVLFVGSEVNMGPREDDIDGVGLEEVVGIADTLGDAVEKLSQAGTSQESHSHNLPHSATIAPV
jgi:hypothetical protein